METTPPDYYNHPAYFYVSKSSAWRLAVEYEEWRKEHGFFPNANEFLALVRMEQDAQQLGGVVTTEPATHKTK